MSKKTATKKATPKAGARPTYFERFHWTQRISHALLLLSFTTLAITGLPQKYALAGWAQALVRFFGGIESMRTIHHIAASVMMVVAVYHLLDAGYKIFVRRVQLTMLPGLQDAKDGLQAFLYNLGFKKTRPQMGRYTFEEKMEYWSLVWGTIIMAITGFMMWNPIRTAGILPGEIIPAAKAAHGGEALLAVAAIVLWHMYGVHVRRFNKSMFTGKMTEEEMLHEHPLELADIKSGLNERSVDAKTLRKRQTIYYPVAGVLSVFMLTGLYGFINGERTAITTLPPKSAQVQIYLPATPTPMPTRAPSPTGLPTSTNLVLTWNGYVGQLLQTNCGTCHGANSFTGLSMDTYANIMLGGPDGPVIIPNDPEGSPLIQVQSAGGHAVQLNAADLENLRQWIAAGAPEN